MKFQSYIALVLVSILLGKYIAVDANGLNLRTKKCTTLFQKTPWNVWQLVGTVPGDEGRFKSQNEIGKRISALNVHGEPIQENVYNTISD